MIWMYVITICLAVLAIGYAAHCAITFQKFNDGIKDWAENLDKSTADAINRAARNILRELDERISEEKEESFEPINDLNDENDGKLE